INRMSSPAINVTIVDALGFQQTFSVRHLELDCGSGSIDIRPGKPAFCRDFDQAALTLDEDAKVTLLKLIHGTASLTGAAVHVICERVETVKPQAPISPKANPCPVKPPAATTKKQQTKRNL
ncbi:MAG: hypothetical protein U0984_14320, partial [Prosthecobacter sp.]|nr:hypothetical protein [Prosthecobacter sp.]